MSSLERCPNCNSKLKRYKLLNQEQASEINDLRKIESPPAAYCENCAERELKSLIEGYKSTRNKQSSKASSILDHIPILSTHMPHQWDYEALGIVTGQSTIGTGALAEFSSGFTDFFGTQSKTYNKKIQEGERVCFNQLRSKTLDMGGNAVIAADIDYSEMGSLKGMIMVCSTGTAIKLKDLDVLQPNARAKIDELESLLKQTSETDDIIAHLNDMKGKLLYT